MTNYAWITDRPPTEDDIDVKDCIFVPEYRAEIKSKAQSVTLEQYFAIFKEGHPWCRTKRPRKCGSCTANQNQLNLSAEPPFCANCRFYDPFSGSIQGICRRYAPKPTTGDTEHSSAFWPEVIDSSWCGEWEAKS